MISNTRQKRIDRLQRRADILRARIQAGTIIDQPLSYDNAELVALLWAIKMVKKYLDNENPND